MTLSPTPSGSRSLPLLSERGWFDQTLAEHGTAPLIRSKVETLQVNVGKLCNQACQHCHVEAGPKRKEIMQRRVAERVIALLKASPHVSIVDITGGAPELNPNFRWLVAEARGLGRTVIDRCNLSVLFEPGMSDLVEFLVRQKVHIVASLPCYQEGNVDQQRGKGVFWQSIKALKRLNAAGYGRTGSQLLLDLVYNPVGALLPPAQATLEATYKDRLFADHGVVFNHLLTITNMPISRFAHQLERSGKVEAYMELLESNFNPGTVPGLMCRSLVSVAWNGQLFDCDFNQMLELPLGAGKRTVWDIDSLDELTEARIRTKNHCFGCTAGAGSSCSGALG
jgi:radical SAM/Cys-rich protein